MTTTKKFNFHIDPGHGWLEVHNTDIAEAGMTNADFSSYSYMDTDNGVMYLEEDCDAGKFLDAHDPTRKLDLLNYVHHDQRNAPECFIRRLPSNPGEWSPFEERATAKAEPAPSSLYKDIIAAGIETDHHESDLYVRDCEQARAIIAKYGQPIHQFWADDGTGRWLDVAFQYEPYWEAKQKKEKDEQGHADGARAMSEEMCGG